MSMLVPLRFMLLIGLFTLVQGQTLSAADCHSGMTRCRTGLTAIGGCYDPNTASCRDGLICESALSISRRGTIGPGACFDAEEYFCDAGRIRMRGASSGIVFSKG